MIKRELRNYEVSAWSLQDDFLVVLKHANQEFKNQIQSPELIVDTDGTQEFSFNIPMYISENGEKILNELWYSYKSGLIVANLRKIKIILNKDSDDEEIFELLITKVTEKHENNQLSCNVECEGLAFQELGKTGYKISLTSDDFYLDDLEWFQGNQTEEPPRATLDYWCKKFLDPYPTNPIEVDPHKWYYEVCMDWSAFTKRQGNSLIPRQTNLVYEDEYVSSWDLDQTTNELVPKTVEYYKEKERLVDLSESNKYNLTQDLAETFGIYCKYVFDHDDNYHITGRRVVFYNNFFSEEDGTIDINYKYNTASIQREMDGSETITKMYVRPVDNSETIDGQITIMNVDANRSREDYLLNFDYLHDIGAIDDDLYYKEVPKFELEMRQLNLQLEELALQLEKLQFELPEIQAKKQLALTACGLDQERLNAANDLLNSLIRGGSNPAAIEVTAANPKSAVLLQRNDEKTYYVKISEVGIIPETLQVYKTINYAATEENRLSNKLEYQKVTDEFGNIVELNNIQIDDNSSRIVYLTYEYVPRLYYEKVKDAWTLRLNKDEKDYQTYTEKEEEYNSKINEYNEQYNELLSAKKALLKSFEHMMGPAIREGFWQPDDYKDYGDVYLDTLPIDLTYKTVYQPEGESKFSNFFWDNELFEEEQNIYYETTVSQQKVYYPCIELTPEIRTAIYEHLDKLSLLYFDYKSDLEDDYSDSKLQALTLGSSIILSFVHKKGTTDVKPVLLIIGADKLSDTSLKFMYGLEEGYVNEGHEPFLGILETKVSLEDEDKIQIKATSYYSDVTASWLKLDDSYECVFSRIGINSLALKVSEDQLFLRYNNSNLTMYEDYNVLSRAIANKYCITIKPEVFLRDNNYAANSQIKFTLSNANTAIYLDARQVLKDSAYPQVSYDVQVSTMDKRFIRTINSILSRIANINDWELHFDNVQGYVSQVNMHLDAPWEDTIKIKNYKTKFEDLFTKIVASTEQMKKSQFSTAIVTQALQSDGSIRPEILQQSVNNVDLNYAFNNGKLTIDETNGILCNSDTGMVAIRGGGIFTATTQDANGNWQWNTGILPSGINADLIKTGQLDTNLIKIYAGDKVAFQWNADGLYAYKTISNDPILLDMAQHNSVVAQALNGLGSSTDVDTKQYVVHNADGLFLTAEAGALVPNSSHTSFKLLQQNIDRVEISWDGLKLRNWNNDVTFFANPETGNLFISGVLDANNVKVLTNSADWYSYQETNAPSLLDYINSEISNIDISDTLEENFLAAGDVIAAAFQSISSLISQISEFDTESMIKTFSEKIKDGLIDNRTLDLYGSSSVNLYNGDFNNDSTLNVMTLNSEGIKLFSNSSIQFQVTQDNTTVTSLNLENNKIQFGVAGETTGTSVELTKDYMILSTIGNITDLRNASPSDTITGIKLTKDWIRLSTKDENNITNLISMGSTGIQLQSSNSANNGNYIHISPDQLELGGASSLSINTTNLLLKTYENISNNTFFRLGTAENAALTFGYVNNSPQLIIKGAITATSLTILDGDNQYSLSGYIDNQTASSTQYLHYDSNGLTISNMNNNVNNFDIHLTNTALQFRNNQEPIAYITGQELVISNALINNSLSMDNYQWKITNTTQGKHLGLYLGG